MRTKFLTLFIVLSIFYCQAQISKKEAKAMNHTGENLIATQYYGEALKIYEDLTQSYPEDKNYNYHLAICQIHTKNYLKEGLSTLINLKETYNEEDFVDFAFHIAHGYYYNHQHEEAKDYFQKYLTLIQNSDRDFLIDYVKLQAAYNDNAILLYHGYDTTAINVSNLELPLNTSYNEYSPYVTPDESAIYFTYSGEKSIGGKQNPAHKLDEKHGRYYEDIYVSYRHEDGAWGDPESMTSVNTYENESCIGISHTGEYIFVFKSNRLDNGDIYFAKKEGNDWGHIIKFGGDVNTEHWEGSVTMSMDGETIYFSSDRPGGFGGRDIYSANLLFNNMWGNVKNLGPEINSKYDEDAPYILPDGKTLYYSSNGNKSMGGFDIFFTKKIDNKWAGITNAGIPVNSIKDERFYSISADGQTGYFSRTNEHSGHEDQDIYDVNPGMLGDKPILALISGKVYLDNQNENASVVLRDLETGNIVGTFETNPKTGLFSMLVSPDKKYAIEVMVDNKVQYTDSLETDFIKEFIRLQHDYHAYSEDYHGEVPVLQISLQKHLEQVYNKETGEVEDQEVIELKEAFAAVKSDTLEFHKYKKMVGENRIDFYKNNPEIAAKEGITPEMLSHAEQIMLASDNNGVHNLTTEEIKALSNADEKSQLKAKEMLNPTFSEDEIVYRVQVAAYRKPENYSWTKSKTFGDVMESTYADGITRFTIGGTKHYKEAEQLRKKLIKKGIEDAFIVSFKGEERILLHSIPK